jgi:hypothetical protein
MEQLKHQLLAFQKLGLLGFGFFLCFFFFVLQFLKRQLRQRRKQRGCSGFNVFLVCSCFCVKNDRGRVAIGVFSAH